MTRLLFPFLFFVATVITGCPKNDALIETEAATLRGMWIREGDLPGRDPADTLLFFPKSGRNLVAFYIGGSPGPGLPAEIETEYKYEGGKLSLKDYSSSSGNFIPVESFQWIDVNKEFSTKLHQIVHFISADYRVTYRKIN